MEGCVRITAVIDHLLSPAVRHALSAAGARHYYVQPARSAHLEERHGIAALFERGLRLRDDASDLFTLFVPEAEESAALELFARCGQLAQPGMGSVFSERVALAHGYAPLLPAAGLAAGPGPAHDFYSGLTGIACIVQRGRGDRIAREVLELGASVPTLHFGTGMGLRDRLGLLRVTIPAEKEVITLVDSRRDAPEVIEHIIRAGRLDLPGQGFIYAWPLERGLINTRLTRGQVGQAASIDRVVATLDSLTGGVAWRSAAGLRPELNLRDYFQGVDLTLIAPEERIEPLFRTAMAAGVKGATIAGLRLWASGDQLVKARAACNMFLPEELLPAVIERLEAAGAFTDEAQAVLFVRRIERAFTYRPPERG